MLSFEDFARIPRLQHACLTPLSSLFITPAYTVVVLHRYNGFLFLPNVERECIEPLLKSQGNFFLSKQNFMTDLADLNVAGMSLWTDVRPE